MPPTPTSVGAVTAWNGVQMLISTFDDLPGYDVRGVVAEALG